MCDLSVSIVTHNSGNELHCILDSLKNSHGIDFSVTVIDNNSTDNSVSAVRSSGLNCELICLKKNTGYGTANNIAIRKSDARYHLIVNPDIKFGPQLLKACAEFMDTNPDVAIVTPKLLNPDGSEQYTPKKRPRIPYLAAGFIENHTGKIMRLRSEYTLRGQIVNDPVEIDFCAGCFMFCRTSMLKACGGFDERFFLYFDDADLTLRIQEQGKTVYAPALVITHIWKRENQKAAGILHELASMTRFFRKWRRISPAGITCTRPGRRSKEETKQNEIKENRTDC